MILLTMLLKYCLEKHENRNRIVEKDITACTTTLFLNVVNVRMNSNTASGSEIQNLRRLRFQGDPIMSSKES